jgi:hypothetical protein
MTTRVRAYLAGADEPASPGLGEATKLMAPGAGAANVLACGEGRIGGRRPLLRAEFSRSVVGNLIRSSFERVFVNVRVKEE